MFVIILTISAFIVFSIILEEQKNTLTKEQKLWSAICIALLAINVLFFIPDTWGDYITILDAQNIDIDNGRFFLQFIAILGLSFLGYILHSLSYEYNDSQNIPTAKIPKTSFSINKSNNLFALSSFICGIVGYFFSSISLLLGIASLVLGIIGVSSFNQNNEKNKWFAIVGIILGIFCILRPIYLQ